MALVLISGNAYREMKSQWGGIWWLYAYLGNVPTIFLNRHPPIPALVICGHYRYLSNSICFFLYSYYLRKNVLPRVLGGMVVLACFLRFLLLSVDGSRTWIQYVFTCCRMDALVLGALLSVLLASGRYPLTPRASLGCFSILSFGCTACFLWFGPLPLHPVWRTAGLTLVGLMFFFLLASIVQEANGTLSSALAFPPMQYLGRISYGLYLLHLPVGLAVRASLESIGFVQPTVTFALQFAASVAAATVSWYALEKPILRLKSRFSSSRHPFHAPAICAGT